MGRGETRRNILSAAQDIVLQGGLASLTFDAVAKRLGLSKQAVIYWFPRKEDLLAAVAVPMLRDEATAAVMAMRDEPDHAAAVRVFVTTVAEFHFADLDRFRLMYLAPQFGAKPSAPMTDGILEQVHALTSSMYDALQAHAGTAEMTSIEARRAAVAIHMAVLGLVTVVATTEALGDPLLHDKRDLLDTMADLLAGKSAGAGRAGAS